MATLPSPSFSESDVRRKPSPIFRYRTTAIYLAVIYILFLIVPWAVTCILMARPMLKPSYNNQAGHYLPQDLRQIEQWRTGINVVNRIACVIAIPVVSAILAQAAVVFTQRRKAHQELGLEQMLTLADRGWLGVSMFGDMLFSRVRGRARDLRSSFLFFATGLILFSAVLGPLQSLMIQEEVKQVVTCLDIPGISPLQNISCAVSDSFDSVGYDVGPTGLSICPQNVVVRKTMNRLSDANGWDVQPRLWIERNSTAAEEKANSLSNAVRGTKPYFVSSLANGTSTGVLRQHAARLDSNVECALVKDEEFPATCPGDRPLTTVFSRSGFTVRVCAEGRFDAMPWTRSRNKQEIKERLWMQTEIDFFPWNDYWHGEMANTTVRCDSTSTRGWFELGNHWNDYAHGPILDTWPTDEELYSDFNDYSRDISTGYFDSAEDKSDLEQDRRLYLEQWGRAASLDIFGTKNLPTPGPLMTTALAMFGNASMFHVAKEADDDDEGSRDAVVQICEQSRIPFTQMVPGPGIPCSWARRPSTSGDDKLLLPRMLGMYYKTFQDPAQAQTLFEIGTFFANEALLTSVASIGGSTHDKVSRLIYSSPGYAVIKPRWDLGTVIAVSALVGIQVLALSTLLLYIYSVPTWTRTLDARALVRIGMQLGQEKRVPAQSSGLTGLARPEQERDVDTETEPLKDSVPEDNEYRHDWQDDSSMLPLHKPQSSGVTSMLSLGGPGVISRHVRESQWGKT